MDVSKARDLVLEPRKSTAPVCGHFISCAGRTHNHRMKLIKPPATGTAVPAVFGELIKDLFWISSLSLSAPFFLSNCRYVFASCRSSDKSRGGGLRVPPARGDFDDQKQTSHFFGHGPSSVFSFIARR